MDNISIIIRNKNEEEFIGFAIQSCLDFFDKPEIIIIDNNSTDESMQVVQNFNNRTMNNESSGDKAWTSSSLAGIYYYVNSDAFTIKRLQKFRE